LDNAKRGSLNRHRETLESVVDEERRAGKDMQKLLTANTKVGAAMLERELLMGAGI
jgi:hypothetical protein